MCCIDPLSREPKADVDLGHVGLQRDIRKLAIKTVIFGKLFGRYSYEQSASYGTRSGVRNDGGSKNRETQRETPWIRILFL